MYVKRLNNKLHILESLVFFEYIHILMVIVLNLS